MVFRVANGLRHCINDVIRCRLIGIPLAEIDHIMAGGDFFIHLFHQGSEKLLRQLFQHI